MKAITDLTTIFNQLDIPKSKKDLPSFFAQNIAGYSKYKLGKDTNSCPALLIALETTELPSVANPILLEHISVTPDANCIVQRADGVTEENHFTIVRCTSTDYVMQAYFLRLLGPIIMEIGEEPSQGMIGSAIQKLVELFRSLSLPARKTIQGLWAELFLIEKSKNPEILINSWHLDKEDNYDFNSGAERIEVKSVAGRIRRHHFSLIQLTPPANVRCLIASIFVERSGAGVSVADLLDRLRMRIQFPSLIIKTETVISLTLGNAWRKAIEDRFDYELAHDSLDFFDVFAIPTINSVVPPEVTGIHFVADLSQTASIVRKDYLESKGLFFATLS